MCSVCHWGHDTAVPVSQKEIDPIMLMAESIGVSDGSLDGASTAIFAFIPNFRQRKSRMRGGNSR